jgi:hypothetical protein
MFLRAALKYISGIYMQRFNNRWKGMPNVFQGKHYPIKEQLKETVPLISDKYLDPIIATEETNQASFQVTETFSFAH